MAKDNSTKEHLAKDSSAKEHLAKDNSATVSLAMENMAMEKMEYMTKVNMKGKIWPDMTLIPNSKFIAAYGWSIKFTRMTCMTQEKLSKCH